jgi:hypothetical protein
LGIVDHQDRDLYLGEVLQEEEAEAEEARLREEIRRVAHQEAAGHLPSARQVTPVRPEKRGGKMVEWIWANLTTVIIAATVGVFWIVSGFIFGIRGSAEKMRKYRYDLRDKKVSGLEHMFVWVVAFILGPVSVGLWVLKKIFGKGG